MAIRITINHIKLVRESSHLYQIDHRSIHGPEDAVAVVNSVFSLKDEAQEVVCALYLTTANTIAGIQELFDVDALATIVCGLGATPAGAKASRLANVPNNASKVRTISLIVLVATIAFGVVAYLMGNPTPLQLGALALVAVASLAMLVFSHRIVKDLERV